MTSAISCRLIALLATASTFGAAHAAERHVLDRPHDAAASAAVRSTNATLTHAQQAGLGADAALQTLNQYTDAAGITHTRYQQQHRGIPVFGEHIVVASTSDGSIHPLSGVSVTGLSTELNSVTPAISAARAGQIAVQRTLGARASQMQIENADTRLMIFLDQNAKAHLAWVNEFHADLPEGGAPTRPYVIVDAMDGQVLKQWEGLNHEKSATGPGGNLKTGKIEYGAGTTPFLDVSVNGSTCTFETPTVRTIDMASTGDARPRPAFSFNCPRNRFKEINGAYSPLNDAHHAGGVVFDMYDTYLATAPLTFQLRLRVHYGVNYENAFWDGQQMTFGDGEHLFHPLVALDVVAHEVSHGFTAQNSGLIYAQQSGGINESFSDIAGEAAEFFNSGKNDFLVGATIFKQAGAALRYMESPSLDGRSIAHADDYYPGMDVHYSSGVYNRAFFLLTTTPGWDVAKAFQAFGKANKDHWTPSTDFNRGACGVAQAAEGLGYAAADVVAAFAQVGVACTQ